MNELSVLLFGNPAPVPVKPSTIVKEEWHISGRSPDYGTVKPRIIKFLTDNPDSDPKQISSTLGINEFSVARCIRELMKEKAIQRTSEAVTCGRVIDRKGAKYKVTEEHNEY